MGNVAEMTCIVDDGELEARDERHERAEELRLLEALLFAAEEPLDEKALAARLPAGVDVRTLLMRLQQEIRAARRQSGARRRQMDASARRATSPGC